MLANVQEERLPNAEQFLDALNLSKPRWTNRPDWNCNWVFRGQSDSSWHLVPSAWRKHEDGFISEFIRNSKRRYENEMGAKIVKEIQGINYKGIELNERWVIDSYTQARAEFDMIYQFISLSDSLGFSVPDAEIYERLAHHDYIPDIRNIPLAHFLPHPNSASAFAQHHGIPTRGLDWTRDPFVAAFFAAERINPNNTSGEIVVWAVRPDLLLEFSRDPEFNDDRSRFLSKTFPLSKNEYLYAQSGVLFYPTYGCQYYIQNGKWPSFEEFAMRIQAKTDELVIQKLTLGYTEIGELLRLLWLNKKSKAHLMPTFDSVTDSLKKKWEWGK